MDAVTRSQRLEHVRQQLGMYAGEKKTLSNGTMIMCPFHSEKTPSGRIFHSEATLNPGYFICYGCGHRCSWDELAPKIGLQPIVKGPPREEHSMDLLMAAHQDALFSSNELRFKQDRLKFWPIPINKTWRNIPTNLLIELGGKQCLKWSEEYGKWGVTKHLYLPVNINQTQVGYFRARLKKDESGDYASYLLAGGQWSKTHGLWPYDYAIDLMHELGLTAIVLVEGQRDALRLLLAGIPAMCIFGTQSFSSNKAKLLEIAGITRVIILMDGDDAGIKATQQIAPTLKSMFEIKILKLWSIKGSPYITFRNEPEPSKAAKQAGVTLWDPGNMPIWIVNRIKSKYFST